MDGWTVCFIFFGCMYQGRGFAIDFVAENFRHTMLYLVGYLLYQLHAGCCSATVSPKFEGVKKIHGKPTARNCSKPSPLEFSASGRFNVGSVPKTSPSKMQGFKSL